MLLTSPLDGLINESSRDFSGRERSRLLRVRLGPKDVTLQLMFPAFWSPYRCSSAKPKRNLSTAIRCTPGRSELIVMADGESSDRMRASFGGSMLYAQPNKATASSSRMPHSGGRDLAKCFHP